MNCERWNDDCSEQAEAGFGSMHCDAIMTTKTWKWTVGAVFALLSAGAIANVQYKFYADGVTEDFSQQGTALFDFSNDGSTLSVTLTDTVQPTAAVLSSITGLQFSLSSTPAAISLVSVSTTGVIDCSNSSSPCPPGAGSSPYGWGTVATGSDVALGAGFNGSSFSYQPYGIVNASYVSPGGPGGLGDPAVNPLLVGPVTFTFSLSGLAYAPEINSVAFEFGDPTRLSAVPEPQSLMLLALGLIAAGWVTRRRARA